MLERVEGEARAFLDRQAEEISSAGGEVEGTHLASGNAPARIVKLAEELHADLTVLGSRGLGGVRGARIRSEIVPCDDSRMLKTGCVGAQGQSPRSSE